MKNWITASCVSGVSEKHRKGFDSEYPMQEWTVTLIFQGRRMKVPFFQGIGHQDEPKPNEVLNCLMMDASSVVHEPDFVNWCKSLGYESDSIKALGIFEACKKISARLTKFLGEERLQEGMSAQDIEEWAKEICTPKPPGPHDKITKVTQKRSKRHERRSKKVPAPSRSR